MSEIKTGGPAFPNEYSSSVDENKGMSLRDYFAAQAMGTAFNKALHNWREEGESNLVIDCDHIAEASYWMADAMLKARKV